MVADAMTVDSCLCVYLQTVMLAFTIYTILHTVGNIMATLVRARES